MATYPPQLNTACDSYRNVDKCSLHTADPGNNGDNDSEYAHADITWGETQNGEMQALPEFEDVTGSFTHVGLWDGATFIKGMPCQISDVTNQTVKVLLEHKVVDG